MPEYVRAMFLRDGSGNVYLPVYGPATAKFQDENGADVTIREETCYPFEETVTLKISASAPWQKSLRLKLPDWCAAYSVVRNGQEVQAGTRLAENQLAENPDGWITLEGSWSDDTLVVRFEMEPRVVDIQDAYFPVEPLRVVECGPLVFALKYDAVWNPAPARRPLPEGWNWFNVVCAERPRFYALPMAELRAEGAIQVIRSPNAEAYPWEEPPVKLRVPLIRAQKHAFQGRQDTLRATLPPYANPVAPDTGAEVEYVELVPFGSTNLRLTCFPTAK